MDFPPDPRPAPDPATRRLILLLPAAFLAHDIGEIAGNDELNRALGDIAGRFPSLAQRLAPSFTTSRRQMAVAVGVVTAGVAALSVAAARGRPRSPALTLHAAATLVFGGHIVGHAAQAVALRRYLPGLGGGLALGERLGRGPDVQQCGRAVERDATSDEQLDRAVGMQQREAQQQ